MTLLFPAIKAEALVVLYAPDDTVRVVVDWHDPTVDVESFVALAIVTLLRQAGAGGHDASKIFNLACRMMGVQ